MESLWRALENELMHLFRCQNRREAVQGITDYIEVFYNLQREQARVGLQLYAAYERVYYEKPLAA